jgi:hypothetical protein
MQDQRRKTKDTRRKTQDLKTKDPLGTKRAGKLGVMSHNVEKLQVYQKALAAAAANFCDHQAPFIRSRLSTARATRLIV